MLYCPECKAVAHIAESSNVWDYISKDFNCENCNASLSTYVDYSYDEETCEEYAWVVVEKAFTGFDKDTK